MKEGEKNYRKSAIIRTAGHVPKTVSLCLRCLHYWSRYRVIGLPTYEYDNL